MLDGLQFINERRREAVELTAHSEKIHAATKKVSVGTNGVERFLPEISEMTADIFEIWKHDTVRNQHCTHTLRVSPLIVGMLFLFCVSVCSVHFPW